jgi:hypothetical protein
MKKEIEEIIKNNSPEEAAQKILKLVVKPDVIASDFLTYRKLPYGNTMRSIFRKHEGMWKKGIYHDCQIFLHEGYMLAVRRLKNNSL